MEQKNEVKIFKNLEEMKNYFNEETKSYEFFEKGVTEEDVFEEDAEPAESFLLPCGGVFKGDFYAPKKNQIKAANREWRRRKSTGRFYDDGSRWN
jgi:hypothetical protein